MNLIDSHTHLYFDDFEPSPAEAVERALSQGVVHMILPGVNTSTIEPIKKLHSIFPENTSIAVGLHPSDVKPGTWKEELTEIERELKENRDMYSAVGEVGIDLHWEKDYLDLQQQAFESQCQWAVQLNKPLIIHSRDAFEETFEVLKGVEDLPDIVFHSFSGTPNDVERILNLFPTAHFGINGIVTFKNAKIKEVLPVIPNDCLMIETDAPYLAPTPKRGQRNESAFLVYTAAFIAKEKGMSLEELGDLTTANARRFFKIKG